MKEKTNSQIIIDRNKLEGSVDLIGHGDRSTSSGHSTIFGAEEGKRILAQRPMRPDLSPDPNLPYDTRLRVALQNVCGGTWGGCIFDVDAIIETLEAGKKALGR